MRTNWNALDWVAVALVIVGGLNWGLIGLFSFNLVTAIFGDTALSAAVYALVGLAAVYMVYSSIKVTTMTTTGRPATA